MPKPNWAHYVTSIIPFALSAAAVTETALLPHVAGAAASPGALIAGLATGLLVNGISALCSVSRLRAGAEYNETFANHDILRLIRNSLGGATASALEAYLHGRSKESIITSVPQAFQRFAERCKSQSFTNELFSEKEINAATVYEAIQVSRRSLLSDETQPAAVAGELGNIKEALIDSVLETLRESGLSAEDIPGDFRDFLSGPNGLLDQLTTHTLYHLKTDQRAQTAILHFTLQNTSDSLQSLSDSQHRVENLCQQIHHLLSKPDQLHLDELQQRLENQYAKLIADFDQRLNREHEPKVEATFVSASDGMDFTYRARGTAFVGRDAAQEEFLRFMGDPRPGLWTVISGPAGTGKSRLAAELTQRAGRPEPQAGQWRAGFLMGRDDWLRHHAPYWRQDTDTLLVIDYAAELDPKPLAEFLAHLGSRLALLPRAQMRVILIDRLAPDHERGILSQFVGSDSQSMIEKVQWKTDVFALKPLGHEHALQIAQAVAGDSWNTEIQARVELALQTDHELARPLFAFLMGDAFRSGTLGDYVLNPATVSKAALKRLFRHANPEFLEEAQLLWATATACQGISEEALFEEDVLLQVTGRHWSWPESKKLQTNLRAITGSRPTEFLDTVLPLQPDFVGELFVFDQILGAPTKVRGALPLMQVAWRLGNNPFAFSSRLAGDFVGREGETAGALTSRVSKVEEALAGIVLSGLGAEGLTKYGPRSVSLAIYFAFKTNQTSSALRWLESLEGIYKSNEILEIAEPLSLALYNATVVEPDPRRCEELAERIAALRERHDTPEIALQQARALANATAGEPDPRRREELAERIAALRERHDTPEIALQQATALFNATAGEPDPRRREELAERIAALRERHDTPEIALQQATALANATVVEPDPRRREELAERIAALRERHDTPEIALQQATALFQRHRSRPGPAAARRAGRAHRRPARAARHPRDRAAASEGASQRHRSRAGPAAVRRAGRAHRRPARAARHPRDRAAASEGAFSTPP